MSSLAVQLAQSASLNTALLVDRSRRKAGESYLFTGREADQHDLESIHALGVNGLLQLASLEPALRKFEEALFSEYAKSTDRTLLSTQANAELDASIHACLALLGPYLMESPTGKVIEWLVRRFRINEFNVEAVLSLFLPYHESPHFTKMISIIHIKQNSTWSFLLQFKSAAQKLPRMSLVTEMLRSTDVARFVTSLLPSALKAGRCHRVLLAFNAASLHDFISRTQVLDEGTIAYLLPALLEPLRQVSPIKDAVLGTYILLTSLSQKCQIAPAALNIILGAMANCTNQISAKQFTNAALCVCEPQVELESFSDGTLKSILQIQNIEQELRSASSWVGSEKLLGPLLPGLVKRLSEEKSLSILDCILASPKVPPVVVQRSSLLLLDTAVTADVPVSTAARRLLATIQQRYPSAFHLAVDQLSRQNNFDQETVEQLRISLSVVQELHGLGGTTGKNIDMVLASTDAEAKVRSAAVHELVSSISQKGALSDAETKSVETALLARVQDTTQVVVDALYSKPQIILPILSQHAETYIKHLSSTLAAPGSKPKRSLLRSHLTFLAAHFYPRNPSYWESIFHNVIFPFLLFSKPRQHTAEIVWDIISTHLQNGAHEWLLGCALIVAAEREKTAIDGAEKMGNINITFSSQIARNILKSNNYTAHLNMLISKLRDTNPHVKVLSYLIVRSLLRQLSGEHQVDAAQRVLDLIDVEELAGMEDLSLGGDSLDQAIDDVALGKVIVSKPSSRSTLRWLQIAVIALVPTIQKPTGIVLNWLVESSSSSQKSPDQRGSRYVALSRTIYSLANVSASGPLLTNAILQTLFISLKEDALAFLAGIWAGSAFSISEESYLRTVALRHAAAFLEAHIAEGERVDFQTILPSLLVALQSHDIDSRQAALVCITHLHQLADGRFATVYEFDTIYGKSPNQLQYLDQDDFKKYLSAILEHRDHLAHDVDYIKLFHQQHLGRSKTDKKRDSEYKHRVLCYLVSHINAIGVPGSQIALLNSLDSISDSVKAHVLLPTIKSIAADVEHAPHELSGLVVSCLDISVAKDLNDPTGTLWEVFVAVLRSSFAPGSPPHLRAILGKSFAYGLFEALSAERKIALCELLLDFGTQDSEIASYSISKQLLGNLVEEVPLIVHLLQSLQPSASGTGPRATKRSKTTSTPEDGISRLSLFVEVLAAKELPGSLDLVSHLLETINHVLQSDSSAQADVSYIDQLLMSAIENAASKVVEIPNLIPSAVRLDILVELIRVADNPQTFHQALLLVANLARLAPDSVLSNVMPVFTFMGSNVFHRDDTYSFKVVQQTVDSIVPVMVASLKRAYSQPLDLYIGSKDFLRVFTDAANHIPRHRRTNFFSHLVEVLGAEDFLPPVCMLLIEKVANRIVRQNTEEVLNSLSLPASILQRNTPSLQIRTLTTMLHESQRLVDRIVHPELIQPTFLELARDEDPTTASLTVLRRRAQAIIIFVGLTMKRPTVDASASEEEMSRLVAALISLATIQVGPGSEGKVEEISLAGRSSLNRALSVMSASDFVNAVLSMLESRDLMVQTGALDLFSERLLIISDKTRFNIVPVIVKILGFVKELLSLQTDPATTLSAFKALRSIGLTLRPGEESSVTDILPLILGAINGYALASPAMAALSPLPVKLGPRIIPFFREIISQSVTILREEPSALTESTHSVVQGLLLSIPTFWGVGEVTQVVTLYVDHFASTSSSPSAPMLSLIKAVTKRAPTKVLIPALINIWSSLNVSPQMDRIAAYFDILARALRSAARPVILEQLRALFKIFLESFDIIKLSEVKDAENKTIIAFQELVVKLNEAAFRPLFRRLYDWAFASEADDLGRKGLMNPYMSFLLEPFVESLKSFTAGSFHNQAYWNAVVETLTKSMNYDDGAFWRDDKLRQVASPLIQQVPFCVKANSVEGKTSLQDSLLALVDSATDDMLLKAVNLEILMHTRSEDVRLRLFALTCGEKLWRVHGGKLLGFVAETTTFIAECTEDENDMVVRESFRLKDAVESVAGNINGL
ncbi:U3 small nucleolar RNA-associated protein 10 [Hypsizygus marmoreus]|uniref:U3 small nucleolar RNA-associated protein 10 n=1 Tax=Hypsizygus marmoreus TaxID=39966 RepID=A0A369JRE6_HYPMA|nr:U3 small nucleolar RNA-associated protein 10 [Hypsizygus marmoreus]